MRDKRRGRYINEIKRNRGFNFVQKVDKLCPVAETLSSDFGHSSGFNRYFFYTRFNTIAH